MATPWPFDDPENVAVITTQSILAATDWIGLVTHDADDGSWQFLPLEGAPSVEEAKVLALREMVELDESVCELADLPLGWRAWRKTRDGEWIRSPLPPDDES